MSLGPILYLVAKYQKSSGPHGPFFHILSPAAFALAANLSKSSVDIVGSPVTSTVLSNVSGSKWMEETSGFAGVLSTGGLVPYGVEVCAPPIIGGWCTSWWDCKEIQEDKSNKINGMTYLIECKKVQYYCKISNLE